MKHPESVFSIFIKHLALRWRQSEPARFAIVGAYNALFGLAIFALLHQALHGHLHYLVILPIAHVFAVINAFIGHRLWTYRVQGNLLIDFLRFNVSYLGLLVLGMIAMPLLVNGAGVHPIVASAMTLVLTTLASFFAHKYISFRRKNESHRKKHDRRPPHPKRENKVI